MDKELEDKKVFKPKKPKGKTFTILYSKRIGSNKDGSAKEVYVKGKEVTLYSKSKIERLKSLKII